MASGVLSMQALQSANLCPSRRTTCQLQRCLSFHGLATFSLASLTLRRDPTPGFPVESQHLTFAVSWASNERLHTNTKQYPDGFRPCMPATQACDSLRGSGGGGGGSGGSGGGGGGGRRGRGVVAAVAIAVAGGV